jgi:FkbM family methyltransferase
MRTGLSKPFLFVARDYPVVVRGFLSVLPFPLHRLWIVQQMLRATSGFHLTARTRLDNGMSITTFVGDEIGDTIYTCGIYELATVRLLNKLLDKETVFFDIGAHIGQYTLMGAPLAREVHCFEPMPWIYEILQYNIRSNNLANVSPNSIGIMDYTGSAEVWQGYKENSGSGSFLRIAGVHDRSYSVDCITLDGYCETRKVALMPRKILIKMDVERTELNVLRGAVRLFEYEPTVIVEFNDWSDDLEEIVRFFEERKYSLQAISDSGLQRGFTIDELFPRRRQSNYANILAEPPQP